MKRSILFFVISLSLLLGCRRDPLPNGAIKRDVFISILVDVHIAEGIVADNSRLKLDSLTSKSLYLSVLQKYKVTEEQMLKTTLYYSRNQKDYDKIFSEVLSKINALTEEENATQAPVIEKLK